MSKVRAARVQGSDEREVRREDNEQTTEKAKARTPSSKTQQNTEQRKPSTSAREDVVRESSRRGQIALSVQRAATNTGSRSCTHSKVIHKLNLSQTNRNSNCTERNRCEVAHCAASPCSALFSFSSIFSRFALSPF